MTGHQARAVRHNGPGAIWHAECPKCGVISARTGKERAAQLAADHKLAEVRSIAEGMTCDCLHPDESEFYPDYTCAKCQLLVTLGETA